MTMMNEVSGACVTAARKPTIPRAIRVCGWAWPKNWAMSLPSAPPIESEGAKMPAGTPAQVVSQVAMNLSTTKNGDDSPGLASRAFVCRLPLPKVAPRLTMPITATPSPQAAAKRTGYCVRIRVNQSRERPASDTTRSRENSPPASPQLSATTRPGRTSPMLRASTWITPKWVALP